MTKSPWKYLILGPFILGFLTLSSSPEKEKGQISGLKESGEHRLITPAEEEDGLAKIRKKGQITVITRNDPHCFYIYRGEAMGFEHDLARAFASFLGVDLRVQTAGWGDIIEALNTGRADFTACRMVVTPSHRNLVDFSKEYLSIQQRVVLHKDNNTVKKLEDLSGKTIHLRTGTRQKRRLDELKAEGFNLIVKLHDGVTSEELIRRVANREIEITVADSNVALLNRRYYPDIRVGIPIEEPQSLGWAVKKGQKALLAVINDFLDTIKDNGTLEHIHKAYYGNTEVFDRFDVKKFHERISTRLPRYEATIKKAAEEHGFDWKLIAAVVYQESHFDPQARSHRGVRGLMQLTEVTAKEMGVSDRLDPEQSIMGGVKYLKKLYQRYHEARGLDRILITLASYNVGPRHVLNAQRIAQEKGLEPYRWSSLEQTLPLLCHEEYLKMNKFGYCRGTEPVRYVNRVLLYFDILKRQAMTDTVPERLT